MTLPPASDLSKQDPLWQHPWAAPAALAVAFISLLIWTWQRWADLLVDFAVQLYVPWQLSQGKVLYRDIAHYTGPLSVYYNALAFRLFGVNLRVLEFANLPVLIAIVILIYCLALRMGGRLCALICSLSFLILFAFAHLTIAGNYNFVCPYEYDYTHATLLSLACIIALHRLTEKPRPTIAALAGFLAGLVFLTRAEFFVALIAAAAIAFLIVAAADWKKLPASIAIFALTLPLPTLIGAFLLSFAMPFSTALHGTLGMWPALLRGNVSSQLFYLHSIGLDDIPRSLHMMFAWSAAWCIPAAAFAAWAARPAPRRSIATLGAVFALGALYAGWHWLHRDWQSLFRPLPLLIAAIFVVAIVRIGIFPLPWYSGGGSGWGSSRSTTERRDSNAALPAILSIFSLVLMCKILLYARIIHYGCWLAMPAVMLLIVALFNWIPATLRRLGGCPGIFLSGMSGVWTVVLLVHLVITHTAMGQLTTSVGSGPDQFWADAPRATCVNNAVLAAKQIPPEISPAKTLACFPEGIIINYLARIPTPTPYVNFNPPDLLLFGESQMLASLRSSPPDFIFLVHKDTIEFGERFFGRDYGQKIFAWIQANYQEQPLPMLYLGAEPLHDSQFGIRLLIRRPNEQTQRRLIYGPQSAEFRQG
jgi:hypothetical protein